MESHLEVLPLVPLDVAEDQQFYHEEENVNLGGSENELGEGETRIESSDGFVPPAPDNLKPKIGMEFSSEEEAYKFYNSYTRCCGFGIRKCQLRKLKSGEVSARVITCSAEGHRLEKHLQRTDRKKKAVSMTRCGCRARIIVNKKKGLEKWVITVFDEVHNHKLMTPNKSHFIRSHRQVPDSHLDIVQDLNEVGLRVSRSLDFFSNEAGGRQNLGYGERDLRNAMRKRRLQTHGQSAQLLVSFFQQKALHDFDFSYEVQIDDESRLLSCFWVHSKSKSDYEAFGDVVCFDTTYKTNEFDMPFGPFVGVNHHKQTTLFGAGLLMGETIEDFKWLFKAWVQAMGGRAPKVIITDQDPAMANAISQVFPHTVHRLCMWHISQKLPERLSHVFNKHPSFNSAWRSCVHNSDEIEVFEEAWAKMIKDFELEENSWLKHMYSIRAMWIPAFLKSNFMAGMTTTGRSESVNSMFDCFVTHKSSLLEFACGYDRALEKRIHEEMHCDYETSIGKPVLTTKYPMEEQMANIYTREIFLEFQKEFGDSIYYPDVEFIESEEMLDKYSVSHHLDKSKVRIIVWNKEEEIAACPCRGFEFRGIVCKHIIAMFKKAAITYMPPNHILKRWSRDAKDRSNAASASSTTQNVENNPLLRRHILSRKVDYILNEATVDMDAFKVAQDGINRITEKIINLRRNVGNVNETVEVRAESEATNAMGGENELDGVYNIQEDAPLKNINTQSFDANIVIDPHVVRTKGRGNKRIKPSRELIPQGRLCRGCNKVVVGHDKRTCPAYKESVSMENAEMPVGRGRGRGSVDGTEVQQYGFIQ